MTTTAPIGLGAVQPFELAAGAIQSSSDGTAFSKVIRNFLDDVNTQQIKADSTVEQMMTGETENLHEVMLAISKADLTFRLFMDVRNQVISAYREIMQMRL